MSRESFYQTDTERKLCGFVIRVSTDRQAKNPEGSLKNQLQILRSHIDYKNTAGSEKWFEVEKYVLKAVSGKDSLRSKEFERLFNDIRLGKINTVICTALDRISRSVKDFLNFFEFLNRHDVEFVCLKQNYDTTTAQGRLFVTMMMALAEFEREQTSERNKETALARAERGLWNGSQIFGYDLDPNNKGHLIPNKKERTIVNFAFDFYLKCGSVYQTAKELNRRGYRTKEYVSRREKHHPPREFNCSGVQRMLRNLAYTGKREINKKYKGGENVPEGRQYRVVEASWPPIINEEKFHRAQKLLDINDRSNGNRAKPVKHNYLFNGGLIWCDKCGGQMEGGSALGRKGKRYYYYACKNKDCRFRIPANEIESVVLERLKVLSQRKDILDGIVANTNQKLRKELPALTKQKDILQAELTEINAFADQMLGQWANLATEENSAFLKNKLSELGRRRKEIESGLEDLELAIEEIERESVSKELVMFALGRMTDVFKSLNPYQQKELIKLTLNKAVISEDRIKLALYGRKPEIPDMPVDVAALQNQMRTAPPDWVPERDSNRLNCRRLSVSILGSKWRV